MQTSPRNESEQSLPEEPMNKPSVFSSEVAMTRRWGAVIGALAIGVLFVALPGELTLGPNWLLLAVEVALLLPLVLAFLTRRQLSYNMVRFLNLALLAVVTLALIVGVALLISSLPGNTHGRLLLRSAALLWCSNILVFALWYWEIDGGGPYKRYLAGHEAKDFMFPQQVNGNTTNWAPHFFDYVFLAFTGATALSPADTYPLTRPAKALMVIEALLSISIIALLAARAVNILQ
jgi:hypothetical protein